MNSNTLATHIYPIKNKGITAHGYQFACVHDGWGHAFFHGENEAREHTMQLNRVWGEGFAFTTEFLMPLFTVFPEDIVRGMRLWRPNKYMFLVTSAELKFTELPSGHVIETWVVDGVWEVNGHRGTLYMKPTETAQHTNHAAL